MAATKMVLMPNKCMAKQEYGEEQDFWDQSDAWLATHKGKIAMRHIDDGRCLWCQCSKESIKHIFWECPVIKNILRQVCLWFHNKFQVPFFKWDLVLGPRILRQKQILDCVFAVRHVVLWRIWLHRNERIFQRATTPLNLKEVLLECKYVSS